MTTELGSQATRSEDRHVNRNHRIAVLVLAVFAGSMPCRAQESPSTPPPVALIATADFKFGSADAVIVRRPGASPADIIVFKKSKMTAALLEAALDELAVLRALDGDTPTKGATYRISRAKPGAKSETAKDRDKKFAEMTYGLLLQADRKDVPGIGLGEYAEVRPRRRASVTVKSPRGD